MRVATRRLRGALTSFRPLLHRGTTEPLGGELQWLGVMLGRPRDAEVLRSRMAAGGGDLAQEPDQILAERHRLTHTELVEALRGGRYAALRKAASRARYAAELAASLFGSAASGLSKAMTRLQEVLGKHQGSVVARELLALHVTGLDSPGYLQLLAIERAVAERDWTAALVATQAGRLRAWTLPGPDRVATGLTSSELDIRVGGPAGRGVTIDVSSADLRRFVTPRRAPRRGRAATARAGAGRAP